MADQAAQAAANLASVGVVASPPTQRELQLASLNEALIHVHGDDEALRVVIARLDYASLNELLTALDVLEFYVSDDLAARDGFVREDAVDDD